MAADKSHIEDLPLSVRKELANKEYRTWTLTEGEYFDAKDTEDNWCVARAVKVDSVRVSLQYDAWGARYNEVLLSLTPRLTSSLPPKCSHLDTSRRGIQDKY